MENRVKDFKKRLIETINKPEMRILPGQLAFFLLLSIIPLLAVVAAVASKFSIDIENFLNSFSNTLPTEVTDFIMQIIDKGNFNTNIVIFCIIGFILASNGPHSMIIGSNLLYGIKDKDFLTRRIKAFLMTVILTVLFIFVLVVPVFGNQIVKLLTDLIPNNTLDNTINIVYGILKYPVSLFIIFFFIKLLYTIAPDATIKSKTTTKGAIFTTFGWIISTEIYSIYIKKIARYSLLYGSVANLIVLFIWIYILSYIFVLGMALNSANSLEKTNTSSR